MRRRSASSTTRRLGSVARTATGNGTAGCWRTPSGVRGSTVKAAPGPPPVTPNCTPWWGSSSSTRSGTPANKAMSTAADSRSRRSRVSFTDSRQARTSRWGQPATSAERSRNPEISGPLVSPVGASGSEAPLHRPDRGLEAVEQGVQRGGGGVVVGLLPRADLAHGEHAVDQPGRSRTGRGGRSGWTRRGAARCRGRGTRTAPRRAGAGGRGRRWRTAGSRVPGSAAVAWAGSDIRSRSAPVLGDPRISHRSFSSGVGAAGAGPSVGSAPDSSWWASPTLRFQAAARRPGSSPGADRTVLGQGEVGGGAGPGAGALEHGQRDGGHEAVGHRVLLAGWSGRARRSRPVRPRCGAPPPGRPRGATP